MRRSLFMWLVGGLFLCAACNRGELLDVKKQMEDNVETGKRIERMRIQLETDFQNARTFYEAMEKKLYVTGVNTFADGSYVIRYSDGSELHLRNGFTSLVTFGEDGEVVINGEPTGYKPVNGENGKTPVITVDEEGYYVVDGVRTVLLKGEAGADGYTPSVSIDNEGYYCLDGVRIVPEINLKGVDGNAGVAPVPTIHWNEVAGKHELYIDGAPTVPPTYVSPQDGQDGTPSTNPGRYIKQITLSANNELIFTFSDGSVEKSSPVKLNDLGFEVKETKVTDIAIGVPHRIRYAVYTDYTTNPVSVNQMYSLRGWQVLITAPDPVTKEGYITVTPVSGLSASGVLMLMTIDAQQRTVTQKVELSVSSYRINLPAAFNGSYVCDVRTDDGIKIAKVCHEFVKAEKKMLTVVYPCNEEETEYGEGFVADNGGSVDFAGDFYKNGGKAPVTAVCLKSGNIASVSAGAAVTVVTPEVAEDVDGQTYGVAKIGSQYWMTENLKVLHYASGQRLLPYLEIGSQNLGAFSFYADDEGLKNVYGALYNRDAVMNGRLAPVGWHIARENEWRQLTAFLAGTSALDAGRRMKSDRNGGNIIAGEWDTSTDKGNNLSGFTARPAGFQARHTYSGIGHEADWWLASGEKIFSLSSGSQTSVGAAANDGYYNVRCVKDEKK